MNTNTSETGASRMRFRKSINILKGVKLNFSKSGVSVTLGGRGLSANVSKKGVYLNTSLPGTGLYDRKKLFDFGGSKAGKTKAVEPALPGKVRLELDDAGGVLVYDEKGRAVTDPAVLKRLKALPQFQDQQEALMQQRAEEVNALTDAFVNIGLLSADVAKPGLLARRDSRDAVEDRIEAWLKALELPIDFHVDFEYDDEAGLLMADLDLPEIEHLPTRQTIVSGGKLKQKDKTQKALREEYVRCVFGVGMFCASHFFAQSPQMERVLLSAYTQRRDAKTGELMDTSLYSVVYEREGFEKKGYQQQDPETFACRFRNRMNKAAAGDLKAIVPYGPADLQS